MDEENKTSEPVQDTVQESQEPKAEPQNPIFDALYDVSQKAQEEEPVQEEEFSPPTSLMSALHDIGVDEVEPEPIEPDPEGVPPVAEGKTDQKQPASKQKIKRKVVDPDFTPQRKVDRRPKVSESTVDPYVANLVGGEKTQYELAQWASENMSGNKELPQKMLNFYKAQENFIKEQKEMNPHLDLQDSIELKNFISKNRPDADFGKIKDEKITQEAEARAMKRLSGEMERQNQEIHKARVQPQYEQLSKNLKGRIIEAVPEEYVPALKENFKAFAESSPVEAKILNETMRAAVDLGDEFYKITTGMTGFDEKNATHIAIKTFIEREQENFVQSGKTQRGGKTFIRRERMANVPHSEKDKYYTFTDEDIIKLIITRAKGSIKGKLNGFHETLSRSGYVKSGQPNVTQAPVGQQYEQVQQRPSPPPPSQRAGNVPVPQSQGKSSPNKVMELLGL
jgi:hypothetical protein